MIHHLTEHLYVVTIVCTLFFYKFNCRHVFLVLPCTFSFLFFLFLSSQFPNILYVSNSILLSIFNFIFTIFIILLPHHIYYLFILCYTALYFIVHLHLNIHNIPHYLFYHTQSFILLHLLLNFATHIPYYFILM